MQVGLIGLGKMGGNMARRLARGGIEVIGFDQSADTVNSLAAEGVITAASSFKDMVNRMAAPRIVWMMLPSGRITQQAYEELRGTLYEGDVLVDGANSNYKDTEHRAEELEIKGVRFADVGVSGGVWGLSGGYCLMAGGEPETVAMLRPLFEVLAPAPDLGWVHCGPAGSGHFTKMIHNGIEYGMMQALAEGLALLEGKKEYHLDLAKITETWRHGSVVRSWLLDLTAEFLSKDTSLAEVLPVVADSGEGRWTVDESIEQGVPTPVMTLATMMRFSSQGKGDYANKLLAKMRNAFGGHGVTVK